MHHSIVHLSLHDVIECITHDATMRLRRYFEIHGILPAAFARRIGRSRNTVHCWMNGSKKPSMKVRPGEKKSSMELITEETDGAVTANDFL